MKNKLNELRLDAGIARIENQKWLCVLDKETGMMIDPLIGLEKFAELIVRECKENFAKVWYEQGVDCRGAELDKFMARFEQHFGVEE